MAAKLGDVGADGVDLAGHLRGPGCRRGSGRRAVREPIRCKQVWPGAAAVARLHAHPHHLAPRRRSGVGASTSSQRHLGPTPGFTGSAIAAPWRPGIGQALWVCASSDRRTTDRGAEFPGPFLPGEAVSWVRAGGTAPSVKLSPHGVTARPFQRPARGTGSICGWRWAVLDAWGCWRSRSPGPGPSSGGSRTPRSRTTATRSFHDRVVRDSIRPDAALRRIGPRLPRVRIVLPPGTTASRLELRRHHARFEKERAARARAAAVRARDDGAVVRSSCSAAGLQAPRGGQQVRHLHAPSRFGDQHFRRGVRCAACRRAKRSWGSSTASASAVG